MFRAHTDPDLFVQWQGPHGLESSIDVWDCRSGGSWRYVSVADGQEHGFHGCFHDVRPSEVIVQTFTYEGFPDAVSQERLEGATSASTRFSPPDDQPRVTMAG